MIRKECRRGFTLIELLAVIIILGVLMIIAIPSVTEYIQSSRKNSYDTIVKEYIAGARNMINSGEMKLYDQYSTYYIPTTCIPLERGGDSPFGEFDPAYVVVTYQGNGYDYYFSGRDTSGMGIYLTYERLLTKDSIKSGVKNVDTTIGIGNRENIIKLTDSCDLDSAESYAALGYVSDRVEYDGNEDNLVKKDKLYDKIINQNLEDGTMVLDNHSSKYVSVETGINFGVAPSDTNGKGVYVRNGTESDTYPIYYYRGAVTNNNVIFGGFCWKIVRTTETGGIKLIYNGIPTEGICDNTGEASQIGTSKFNVAGNDNSYIGYMYGSSTSPTNCKWDDSHTTYSCEGESASYNEAHLSTKTSTSSTIKTYIDSWYSQNMKSYTSYLEDTVWCNDRTLSSGSGFGNLRTNYGSRGRIANSSPTISLECENKNDRFTVNETVKGRIDGNGALTYPVALLTADELTLAGNGYKGYSGSSYLTSGVRCWSLSPSTSGNGEAYSFAWYPTGDLHGNGVGSLHGVRPSISLSTKTLVNSTGDGSASNPFVV